jgi:hypothetical protein
MHRSISVLALVVVVLVVSIVVAISISSTGHGAVTLWVSTTGSDGNGGTKAAPFKTPARAEQAVAALGGASGGDVTVMLEGGTYRLSSPLVIDPAAAGHDGYVVTWRSAPGEHAVLSGARQVPSSSWTETNTSLGIWRSHVGPAATRQLWVNGVRATLARTTMYPSGFQPTGVGTTQASGIAYVPTTLNDATWRDPATWSNLKGVDAVAYNQWKMAIVPVSGLVPATATSHALLTMVEPAWQNVTSYRSASGGPAIWGFWQVAYFENSYQFLDQPGEWYLDQARGDLYYIPLPGQTMASADVELPVLQQLVVANGTASSPIESLRFEDLTFQGTTWLAPGGPEGYVSDQSGMLVTGTDNPPNVIGHARHVTPTPGSIQLAHDQNVAFEGDVFRQMGSAALELGTGTQHDLVNADLFSDVSGSGIELGGVSAADARPPSPSSLTTSNTIEGDQLTHTGAEFVDTAAIFAGFTRATTIEHSTIADVPWSGIAMGWGWGLLDPSGFPGLNGAHRYQWGHFTTPTANRDSVIKDNLIERFLENRWDGGAIYTTGAQGTAPGDGLLISGNVAVAKRPSGGGNTLYTDGGTRYVAVRSNALFDNPIGTADFGPAPKAGDPLPYSSLPSMANGIPYGSDTGGCVTYGDIRYVSNFWMQAPMSESFAPSNALFAQLGQRPPYSAQGYFDPCPYVDASGVSYPTDLTYTGNQIYAAQPAALDIAAAAGAKQRPPSIPPTLWTVPSQ